VGKSINFSSAEQKCTNKQAQTNCAIRMPSKHHLTTPQLLSKAQQLLQIERTHSAMDARLVSREKYDNRLRGGMIRILQNGNRRESLRDNMANVLDRVQQDGVG